MQIFLKQHPELFGLGFGVYFLGLWCFVIYTISSIGGWRVLAKKYRTERPFPTQTMRLRSGTMRWGIGYHSALTLGSDSEGLYLGVLFLARIGHPNLFIPWKDVSIGQAGKNFFLPIQTLRLGPSMIPLTLRPKLVSSLLPSHP